MTPVDDLRSALAGDRIMGILRYGAGGDVGAAVEALTGGGLRVLEVTIDTPGVWDILKRYAGRPGLHLGGGTVTTSEQVRRLADVGASFVVSPGLDEVVVEAALACGLVPVPGVATGSEVLAARRAGADLFKLFPAGGLGLPYFSQLLGPFRTEQFVPTGGIGLDDVSSWLEAGAHAVALGAALAGRQAPAGAAEVDALRTRAVSALAHARSGSTSR